MNDSSNNALRELVCRWQHVGAQFILAVLLACAGAVPMLAADGSNGAQVGFPAGEHVSILPLKVQYNADGGMLLVGMVQNTGQKALYPVPEFVSLDSARRVKSFGTLHRLAAGEQIRVVVSCEKWESWLNLASQPDAAEVDAIIKNAVHETKVPPTLQSALDGIGPFDSKPATIEPGPTLTGADGASSSSGEVVPPEPVASSGIHGRVFGLDENGRQIGPVAGARIELIDQAGSVARVIQSTKYGYYKAQLTPGKYFYRIQAAGYKDEDYGRSFTLTRSDGFDLLYFSVAKGENDPERKSPELPLVAIGALQGRVLVKNEDGTLTGLSDAKIQLRREGSKQLVDVLPTGSSPGSPKEGTTEQADEAGSYAINLEAGSWKASAVAPGFDRFVDPLPIAIRSDQETKRDFVFTREPKAEPTNQGIKGTVFISGLDSSKQHPEVNLNVYQIDSRRRPKLVHGPATLESSNRFQFELPAGSYFVTAEADGFRRATSSREIVLDGRYTHVDLTLTAEPQPVATYLVATVVGASGKPSQPLIGAQVKLSKADAPPHVVQHVDTQSNGEARFPLAKLAKGAYVVSASMAGYQAAQQGITIDPARNGEVTLALRAEPEVAPTADLLVLVRSAADYRPLSAAQIFVQEDGSANGTTKEGTTKSDGTSQFTVAPGREYNVWVEKSGYKSSLKAHVTTTATAKNTLVIALDRQTVEFLAKVVDGDDEFRRPVPGATVVLRQRGQRSLFRGTTDAEGLVRIEVDEAGLYDAVARKSGYQNDSKPQIKVAAAETDKPHIFELKKESQDVSVTGLVRYADSRSSTGYYGLADTKVVWRGPAGAESRAEIAATNHHGEFSISLRRGKYSIGLKLPEGFRSTTDARLVSVGPGMKQIIIDVDKVAPADVHVTGIVVYPDQRSSTGYYALSGAKVNWTASSGSHRTQTTSTNSRGQFDLSLPAGDHRVDVGLPASASRLGLQPKSDVTVGVQPGMRQVRIVLDRTQAPPSPTEARLTLVVYEQDDRGRRTINGASVSIEKAGRPIAAGATVEGQYSTRVQPGNYLVIVRSEGRTHDESVLVTASGATRTIYLQRPTQPTSAGLTLQIYGQQPLQLPMPLKGAQIWVMQNGRTVATTTPRQNVHTFSLKTGVYQITVAKDGYVPQRDITVVLPERGTSQKIVLTSLSGPTVGQPQLINLTVGVYMRIPRPAYKGGGTADAPLSGVNVTIRQSGRVVATGRTDGRGIFVGPNLLPGTFQVTAGQGSKQKTEQFTRTQSDLLRIIFSAEVSGGRLTGIPSNSGSGAGRGGSPSPNNGGPKLGDPITGKPAAVNVRVTSGKNAAPLPGAKVAILVFNQPVQVGHTDRNGVFTAQVAPGIYSVWVKSPGWQEKREIVTVPATGTSKTVHLDVPNLF